MRFAVKATSGGGNGKARAGVLQGWGSFQHSVETPALLLSTRKGLPSFITPTSSRLYRSRTRASFTSALSTCESIACPPHGPCCSLYTTHGMPFIKNHFEHGGLRQMLGLPEHLFVSVGRDSIDSLPVIEGTNKLGASFETPSGRLLVRPEKYMEIISSLKPNLWATLADEVPAWAVEKRNKASVERTIRWLDECIALDPVCDLGAVVGGSSLEERSRCAKEVAKRNVSGYWIGGFGLGESMEERPALLNAVVDNLPEEKLRYVSGLGLPEEILEGVAAGIDLFDSTYIYHLTLGGLALVFPLDTVDKSRRSPFDFPPSSAVNDGTKINLSSTIYRKDKSPILEGCGCFTCRNHTRAYINHLLNVHEMLAQILLEIHNTHHYLGFFRSIRRAIGCGTFDMFRQSFIESRRELFVSSMTCS
ncbi:unnamed protein product [Spirodela intermedia]|uniref:Queuine tRNA-ribosyltransferase accessory subunit 2 n=1 Tax=Spirodela intermedia TaxID=51605 RepID=A0A7I8J109_SPIIN|nr:unnamed protein product [Spirodela intermedia]CAA6663916.1 unnamed protein product [Spirodela intermedia]